MSYIEGFSAKKDELLEQEVRDNLINFASNFFNSIEKNLSTEIRYNPLSSDIPEYIPNDIPDIPKTGNKKIVVISDAGENDTNLNRMISVFKKCIPNKVEIINLNEINIKSGCTGCIMCAYERTCIYNDEYNDHGYLTGLIKNFAYQIEWAVDNKFQKPVTFLGAGGHAIFRDFVYSMRHIFKADHVFYKKHQLYDFPQKNLKQRLTVSFLAHLFRIPKIRKQVQKEIRQHMIKPFQELFEN